MTPEQFTQLLAQYVEAAIEAHITYATADHAKAEEACGDVLAAFERLQEELDGARNDYTMLREKQLRRAYEANDDLKAKLDEAMRHLDEAQHKWQTLEQELADATRQRDRYKELFDHKTVDRRRLIGSLREQRWRFCRTHKALIEQNKAGGLVPSLLEIFNEMGGAEHDEIECACELTRADATANSQSLEKVGATWELPSQAVVSEAVNG